MTTPVVNCHRYQLNLRADKRFGVFALLLFGPQRAAVLKSVLNLGATGRTGRFVLMMVALFQKGSVWWVTYRRDSRQVRRSLRTRNKRVAQERKAELELRVRRGVLGEDVCLPVRETLDHFLAYQEARKTKKSAATDRVYLEKFFAAVPVSDVRLLSPAHVSTYLTKRANEDQLAPKTLNRYRQVAHSFCEWLVDWSGSRGHVEVWRRRCMCWWNVSDWIGVEADPRSAVASRIGVGKHDTDVVSVEVEGDLLVLRRVAPERTAADTGQALADRDEQDRRWNHGVGRRPMSIEIEE